MQYETGALTGGVSLVQAALCKEEHNEPSSHSSRLVQPTSCLLGVQ
jgi:hypothetical protein